MFLFWAQNAKQRPSFSGLNVLSSVVFNARLGAMLSPSQEEDLYIE